MLFGWGGEKITEGIFKSIMLTIYCRYGFFAFQEEQLVGYKPIISSGVVEAKRFMDFTVLYPLARKGGEEPFCQVGPA